ncbi:MAG: archease [Gemmataceae bacterium]
MFETFDHTADLGLRIRAADLPTLFAEAGRALLSILVEQPDAVAERARLDLRLPPDDLEYLLFDWLKALLYHFETERMLFARFAVRLDDTGLHARAWGEPLDPARHEPAHEVKAITYHDLVVQQTPEGWLAEVIVDI